MATCTSHGKTLWHTLMEHLKAYTYGGAGDAGEGRPVIWGVSPQGIFEGHMTADGFLAQARKILLDDGRVYRWNDTICFEVDDTGDRQLLVIASRQKAEPGAAGLVANLFCVGVKSENGSVQSLVPGKLVNALLADQDLWRQLPAVEFYARRPVFDDQFDLCGPGWHKDEGVLVHGPDVTPVPPPTEVSSNAPAAERLPPFTKGLLREFCWKGEADLANALALLLTGFLANHFIDDPHPIAIVDGNQKGLGKTLFVQAVGRVLDGTEPPRMSLVRDEELEKKLCAQLRDGRSNILFFDNVRARIESALIEQNALSPLLSFRILGQSATISRPNAYLWVLTSNSTAGTEDLISRGMPIQLYYEGDPKARDFSGRPVEYATQHRLDILGELAGMIEFWKQKGMAAGTQKHRCARWAEVVGGILAANGFGQFLANVEEAEAAMDEGLQALATLAEYVVGKGKSDFFVATGVEVRDRGAPPREWTPIFLDAEVYRDKLADRNGRGRDTLVGQFLSGKVNRSVSINGVLGAGAATLRRREVRSNQKLYYFETAVVQDQDPVTPPGVGGQRVLGGDGASEVQWLPTVSRTQTAVQPAAVVAAASGTTAAGGEDSVVANGSDTAAGDGGEEEMVPAVAAHDEGEADAAAAEPVAGTAGAADSAAGGNSTPAGNDLEWY